MLVNQLIGTKMKVLTGYQGQNEINLAAERGEVQGNNTGLSNLTVNKADWLRDGKVRILLQFGNERLAAIAGRADRHRTGFVRSRPRAAAVLWPSNSPWRGRCSFRRKCPRSARRAAGGVRRDHEGSRNISRKLGASASIPIGSAAKALAERVRDIAATPQAVVDHLHELLARGGVK